MQGVLGYGRAGYGKRAEMGKLGEGVVSPHGGMSSQGYAEGLGQSSI